MSDEAPESLTLQNRTTGKTQRVDSISSGESDAKIRVAKFVAHLPKWRDAVLVFGGLTYVLGYLSWAFYGFDHELGLAPVLDAQYFAAGIFPTVIVCGAGIIAWGLLRIAKWYKQPVPGPNKKFEYGLAIATAAIILPLCVLAWLHRLPARLATVFAVAGGIAYVVITIANFLRIDDRVKGLIWQWIYLPTFTCMAFLAYVSAIFPNLPQAFGGPRPQCVQLDLDVSKLSKSTLQILAPESQVPEQNKSPIVRSRDLYLFFQSGDYLFFKTDKTSSPANQVFRLKSNTIESIFPVTDSSGSK